MLHSHKHSDMGSIENFILYLVLVHILQLSNANREPLFAVLARVYD